MLLYSRIKSIVTRASFVPNLSLLLAWHVNCSFICFLSTFSSLKILRVCRFGSVSNVSSNNVLSSHHVTLGGGLPANEKFPTCSTQSMYILICKVLSKVQMQPKWFRGKSPGLSECGPSDLQENF